MRTKWEYKVVKGTQSKDQLDYLGSEGWELVAVSVHRLPKPSSDPMQSILGTPPDAEREYYFKRPIEA